MERDGTDIGPEVLAAERAFAIRAAYDGLRAAFLAVLAEDARVLGDGPVPGRPVYEAMPGDSAVRLLWDPYLLAASADGTLACTIGPYRLRDPQRDEQGSGIYFSTWRRHEASGHLELVLDFGARGLVFREPAPLRPRPGGSGLAAQLARLAGTDGHLAWDGPLSLGAPMADSVWRPGGFHASRDGSLGVLWGSRLGAGGHGAFAALYGGEGAQPLACFNA